MPRSNNHVVLGINAYSHDAGAALFVDGKLVFAAEQERYDRVKHSPAFPRGAIEAALRHAGLTPDDVGRVAFCWPAGTFPRNRSEGLTVSAETTCPVTASGTVCKRKSFVSTVISVFR